MEIRKAGLNDLDSLVDNRFDFIKELHSTDMVISEDLKQYTYDYMREHLIDDSMVAWIATEGEKIISCAIVCYYNILPGITNKTGKTGYIQNVYTLSEYRHKGLASDLVGRIIKDARERKVGELYLNATDMGRPIYDKLGFELLARDMVYKFK